jgi:selenocysteine-specific translation elongation factor
MPHNLGHGLHSHEHLYQLPLPTGASDPGVEHLKASLVNMVPADVHTAGSTKPFLFAVDHCFSIKGQGTVMTGTVLQVCVGAVWAVFRVV